MDNQITLDELDLITGRLVRNYETQISRMQKHINELQAQVNNIPSASPLEEVK